MSVQELAEQYVETFKKDYPRAYQLLNSFAGSLPIKSAFIAGYLEAMKENNRRMKSESEQTE